MPGVFSSAGRGWRRGPARATRRVPASRCRRRRRRVGRCGSLGLRARIHPAGVNLVVQAPRHLVVDLSPKTGQTAEGCLDMAARAAEPIVEIEVAECGVEVVAPHQAHDASAEPDAFRVSARAVDGLGRLDEFVGFPLIILGGVGLITGRRLAGLILRGRAAALGKCAPIRSGGPGRQRLLASKPQLLDQAPVDAYIPRLVSCRAGGWCDDGLLPPKLVPNAADGDSNDGYFRFCPAKSQLYRGVKLPQGMRGNRAILHLGRTPMNG